MQQAMCPAALFCSSVPWSCACYPGGVSSSISISASCSIGRGMAGLRRLLPRVFALALAVLLLLQLLVSSIVSRSAGGLGDQPAFTVISIKGLGRPDEFQQPDGGRFESGAQLRSEVAYEDENEVSPHQDTKFVLQPWASGQPFFTAEVQRLTQFISKLQVNCSGWQGAGESQTANMLGGSETLCMNHWTRGDGCVAYSFSLDEKDAAFLESTLNMGCEVHRFDPSRRVRHGSGSGSGTIQHHQAWLDWRRPRTRPNRGFVGNTPSRLVDIMDSLDHRMVNVLWANLESAEWKVLKSWVQEGTLRRIGYLILTIHLQWEGFEVSGDEVEVLRFWYSVLRAIHNSGFRLIHSTHGSGHTVLRHELMNTYSSYTLSWGKTNEEL